jgi:hypothetical protein
MHSDFNARLGVEGRIYDIRAEFNSDGSFAAIDLLEVGGTKGDHIAIKAFEQNLIEALSVKTPFEKIIEGFCAKDRRVHAVTGYADVKQACNQFDAIMQVLERAQRKVQMRTRLQLVPA